MKIGITGATGQLGTKVVQQLKKTVGAENLVALVRNPQKASELGVEARAFNYDDVNKLADALKGIEQLLLISSNELGKRFEQHKNVVEAAQQAGVKRIVYTSLLRANTSSLSLAAEHLATEDFIKQTGIAFTILRNGWYTENYAAATGGALATGTLHGSAENGRISSASRQDYAEAAAVVLSTSGHENKVYELAGDTAFTLTELAQSIAEFTGKPISYQNLNESDYANALQQAGLPAVVAAALAHFDTCAGKGDLFDDGKQLSTLINRPTTSWKTTVKQQLA